MICLVIFRPGGTVKMKCPHCKKEVNVIPFGNRFIAVCCNQIIYVRHEPPREDKPGASGADPQARHGR